MKLGVLPESLLERLGLWLGLVPAPLLETHVAATLARSIMAGVELGLFEALDAGPLSAAALAARCGTDPHATVALAEALRGCGYLALADGCYRLSPQSRRWLLSTSPQSIRDKILLQAIEWRWLAGLEDFVRTGRPLDFHAAMSESERDLYHRSMRALARIAAPEAARRMPTPRGASLMLDLGGSHGHFAAEVCRRTPGLRAEVMDLPEAVMTAAPLLAAEGLGDRVVHVIGDVLLAPLGEARFDLILMSNLAHHLDDAENRALAGRCARALKPGGVFVIQEPVHPSRPAAAGQTGTLLGLYFALQSRPGVGTWTLETLVGWQTDAGLRPCKTVRLRTAPGWVQQSARR
jgi:SAM-dependent methyltransferase